MSRFRACCSCRSRLFFTISFKCTSFAIRRRVCSAQASTVLASSLSRKHVSLHVHAVSRFLCIHILDDRNDIHRNCNGGIVAIVTAGATAEDMGDKQPVDYSAEYAVYVAQHDKHTTWTRGRIPLMKGMLCLKSYNHKNTSSHPKSSGVISPSTADYIDRRLGKLGAPAIDWQSARGKVSWFNCRPPKNAKKPLFPYGKKNTIHAVRMPLLRMLPGDSVVCRGTIRGNQRLLNQRSSTPPPCTTSLSLTQRPQGDLLCCRITYPRSSHMRS